MQYLAIFLLVGLGLASAYPSNFDGSFSIDGSQDGPILDKMRETFEKMVNKMKELFDNGKGVSGDIMKKAEDLYEKLKGLKVEIKDKVVEIFEDLKSKIGRQSPQHGAILDRLREQFENLLNKIKEGFDSGKGVRGDLMKKAQDIYDKFRNLGGEFSEKIKSLFEDLRSKLGKDGPTSENSSFLNIVERLQKLRDLIKQKIDPEKLKEKIHELFGKGTDLAEQLINKLKEKGDSGKQKILDWIDKIIPDKEERSISHDNLNEFQSVLNIVERLQKLKDLIKQKIDPEKLKEKIHELFGKGTDLAEQLINKLKEKGESGKQKILDWIDKIIPDKEERSISDVYDKLKEFFKDLELDLKERFTKFGEWVKEQYEKGLEKGKTRAENIKKIAKEFIEDTKDISKDMAEEALGFFREYKKDLGKMYDNVVDKIAKILKS